LATKLEFAVGKLALMIPMVFMFGLLYWGILKHCEPPSSSCANNAIPICTSTGLPPLSSACPIVCTTSDIYVEGDTTTAICPDEPIPDAILELPATRKLGQFWKSTEVMTSYAGVTPGRCQDGTVGYLCPASAVVLYALSSDYINVTSVLARSNVVPVKVVVADYGDTTCSNPNSVYGDSATLIANSTQVPTPAHNTGQSVFTICYIEDNTATKWKPLAIPNGGKVTLVVGDAATCSAPDCSSADLNAALRYDNPFMDSMYFSMVVHSTIGFGDISPISQRGMMLVALQALVVLGVAYF